MEVVFASSAQVYVPLAQLLLPPLLRVLPLYPVNGDLARLLDRDILALAVEVLLEHVQALGIAQRAQRLGGLVSAHGVLLQVLEHLREVGDGGIVASLSEAVGQLVLEKGRGRGEGGGDGLDGLKGLGSALVLDGEVLEREEGAEPDGQWGRLGAEALAQAGDGGRHCK